MLAKLSAPRYSRVWYRRSLFQRLSELSAGHAGQETKVVWVAGQAGSGKSVLAASYLESCEQPHIWYQLDRGDADPSSFFHYLDLALRHLDPELPGMPRYTPDSLRALEIFARQYFRQLADTLPQGTVLVLDNYQELPETTALHRVLCLAAEELASSHRLLVLSRNEPPPEFSRLQAYGDLRLIGQGSLNLAEDEIPQFAEYVFRTTPSVALARRLYQRTQGWITGVLLLLQQQDDETTEVAIRPEKDLLRRYFRAEVFSHMSSDAKEMAMSLALVPRFSLPAIPKLLDEEVYCQAIVDDLLASPFVNRLSSNQDVCQFHPLFRDFLLAEARDRWPESIYKERCLAVGLRHSEQGMVEEAIVALTESGAQAELADLLIVQSPQLFVQGRYQTLCERLAALKPATIRSRPWLGYWQAMATLPRDPLGARHLYEQAYNRFKSEGHYEAALMAWAGIVQSYHFHWGSFAGLDHWIEELHEVLGAGYETLDLSIQLQVTNGIYCSLLYRQMNHPEIELWRGRAMALLERCEDVNARLDIGQKLLMHSLWSGKLYSAEPLVEQLAPMAEDASPITAIYWWAFAANYHWLNADLEQCLAVVGRGLSLIQDLGLHSGHEFFLLSHAVYALLFQEKVEQAKPYLRKLNALVPPGSALHKGHSDYLIAYVHYMEGDLEAAQSLLLSALESSHQSGTSMPIVLVETALATVYMEMKNYSRAARHLRAAEAVAQPLNSEILEFKLGVLQTLMAHHQAKGDRILSEGLRRTFSAVASGSLCNIDWCRSTTLAHLCALALRHDIETDTVQRLIRRRNLVPQKPFQALPNWAWSVKIFTLGQFSLVIDGKPLESRGKSQAKVLDLLKVLLAYGGRDVADCHLLDALWPDAEGHMALQNLKATVYRARKLLGPEVLLWQGASLSLNPAVCWVDTWALEEQLDHLGDSGDLDLQERLAGISAVAELYRGGFLAGEERGYALLPRERLRSRFLRSLTAVAAAAVAENRCLDAINLYQHALDIEPLAEQLYRELMQVHIKLGQKAEALAVYNKCSEHLRSQLQLEPSKETSQLVEFDA